MKYEEISSLSVAEMTKRRKELRQEMFEARMKNTLGQLSNPLSIRNARRDIARISTALNMKSNVKARGK